jgi:hypothetical protein
MGHGVVCWLNRTPWEAIASILGVRANELPLHPRLSDRCWSVQMKRMLGFFIAAMVSIADGFLET